jgi:hypothetical protein
MQAPDDVATAVKLPRLHHGHEGPKQVDRKIGVATAQNFSAAERIQVSGPAMTSFLICVDAIPRDASDIFSKESAA